MKYFKGMVVLLSIWKLIKIIITNNKIVRYDYAIKIIYDISYLKTI